jgi:hypothetical protein
MKAAFPSGRTTATISGKTMLKTIAATLISITITVPACAQSSDPLPDGAGKPLVQKMCGGCHNLRVVTTQRATHDRWETIVQQMVARGIDATDEEIEIMVDYLAKNYPPAAKSSDVPQTSRGSDPRALSLIDDRFWMTASQDDIDALFRFWSRSALPPKATPPSHQRQASKPSGDRQACVILPSAGAAHSRSPRPS